MGLSFNDWIQNHFEHSKYMTIHILVLNIFTNKEVVEHVIYCYIMYMDSYMKTNLFIKGKLRCCCLYTTITIAFLFFISTYFEFPRYLTHFFHTTFFSTFYI